MSREDRVRQWGPLIIAAWESKALPGAWGMGLVRQESDFDPTARALDGGDAARGGSWGLCMMSLKTAVGELGYLGDGPGLLDPTRNLEMGARYFSILSKRHNTRNLSELCAYYNAGCSVAELQRRVDGPHPGLQKSAMGCLKTYIPNVTQFAAMYATKDWGHT